MDYKEQIDRLTTAAEMLKMGLPVPPAVLTEAAEAIDSTRKENENLQDERAAMDTLISEYQNSERKLEAINEINQNRIKRMEEQQNGYRPDFLLSGTRFKLNFSTRGNTDVFGGYAKELQGRWVALVPAEDDKHLAKPKPAYAMCGGCGATDPSQRCIGCFHQF